MHVHTFKKVCVMEKQVCECESGAKMRVADAQRV